MTEKTRAQSKSSMRSKAPRYLAGGLVVGLGAAGLATAGFVTYQATMAPAVVSSALFGSENVTFDRHPEIRVDNGTIKSVYVKPVGGGDQVDGSALAQGSAYRLDTADLNFATKYRVTTTATNARGQETVQKNSFSTFAPERTIYSSVNVQDGATYGAGMPITVTFSEPVINKAKIEKRLKVSTNADEKIVGSWSWENDTTVSYRPKEYWPANTKVTVNGEIRGIRAGDGTTPDYDIQRAFRIGSQNVMVVDSVTHQMTFEKNGQVVQQMPVSMGKPGHETRSGTKVIMSKERDIEFDAATLGVPEDDPDYYKLDVAFALRITSSGEFIHSSPWSAGSQGYYNVSHGCTNVSTDNAAWLYENAQVGDIVKIKNTGRETESGNGITAWDESWAEWKSGSAL
jgi:lipoprotein-anchoring transpeptidase ErfK/SrfK